MDELIRVSEEELADRPGMEGLRKRLLASALAYYQEFVEQRRDDPGAQAELRDTTRRVETILADLAVLRAAGELYLLGQPSVLDDLRLDEGQRAKVATSPTASGGVDGVVRRPGPAAPPGRARAVALEQARANEAEVDAILTPSQQRPAPPDRPPVGGAGRLPRAGGGRGARAHARAARADPRDRGGGPLRPDARAANRGRRPRRPAGRRWSASWPCSPRSRRGAGRRWPASRSGAR